MRPGRLTRPEIQLQRDARQPGRIFFLRASSALKRSSDGGNHYRALTPRLAAMTDARADRPLWLEQAGHKLQALSAAAGETLQAGLQRVRQRHEGRQSHIATYRGML